MDKETDIRWNRQHIKLLISIRLSREDKFKEGVRAKKTLWKEVHKEILKTDLEFPFSCDEIIKKFQNLFTTYKRIKKRNAESGSARTIWDYFEEFDSVYGNKHFLAPPKDQLVDTSNPSSIFEDCNEDTEGTTSINSSVSTQRKRKFTTDLLDYLTKQDEEEIKRHKEFMDLEKEKLKAEKEKLEILKDLKEVFSQYRE